MSENNSKKSTINTPINPVVAGVAGAVVGAGVAVFASTIIKDKTTRKKVNAMLNSMKGQAVEFVESHLSEEDKKHHNTATKSKKPNIHKQAVKEK